MSADSSRVPLRLSEVLERIGLQGDSMPAARALELARAGRELVQNFTVMADSLEWRLADLHWRREGVFPFIDGGVPYLVNNTGTLSADAPAVLWANCVETPSTGPIRVLELGAGTGLFARYFLDDFRRRCEDGPRDFYESDSDREFGRQASTTGMPIVMSWLSIRRTRRRDNSTANAHRARPRR